jgi:uncharacterized protein YbaR (Trm112 family)
VVVIFGWGAGQPNDLGEVAPVVCPNCHNEVFLHHVRSEKKVSLYFVPIASYGTNEYLVCPICGHGLAVAPEQQGAIEQMRRSTVSFRRGALAEPGYRALVEPFWQRLGVAPSGTQVVRPATTVPPPAAGGVVAPAAPVPPASTVADRLENLGRLHREGILSGDEFAAAKRRVLDL